jgi:hypothetical protein
MKEIVFRCDVCQKLGAETLRTTVDRRMDPAGSMEDIEDDIDLCQEHERKALVLAISMIDRDKRPELMTRIRSWKKRGSHA